MEGTVKEGVEPGLHHKSPPVKKEGKVNAIFVAYYSPIDMPDYAIYIPSEQLLIKPRWDYYIVDEVLLDRQRADYNLIQKMADFGQEMDGNISKVVLTEPRWAYKPRDNYPDIYERWDISQGTEAEIEYNNLLKLPILLKNKNINLTKSWLDLFKHVYGVVKTADFDKTSIEIIDSGNN